MSLLNTKRLEDVHEDLVRLFTAVAAEAPFDLWVVEGLRSPMRQEQLKRQGSSQTSNSRHLTGHAVDIAPCVAGQPSWSWPLYYELAPIVKKVAKRLNIAVEWGGDWKSMKDGPHWQLNWSKYPIVKYNPLVNDLVPEPIPEDAITSRDKEKYTEVPTVKPAIGAGAAATVGVAAEVARNASEIVDAGKSFKDYLPLLALVACVVIIGYLLWERHSKFKKGQQ